MEAHQGHMHVCMLVYIICMYVCMYASYACMYACVHTMSSIMVHGFKRCVIKILLSLCTYIHTSIRSTSLWKRIKVMDGPEGIVEGGFVSVLPSPLSTTLLGIPLCLRPDPSDVAAPPPLQDVISLLQVRVLLCCRHASMY
jgi:hypothetical protein